MNDLTTYLQQSELALAAYANLWGGMNVAAFEAALKQNDVGMSPTQAASFAEKWRVVDQYEGMIEKRYMDEFGQEQTYLDPTGMSATVFEEIETGQCYLAVRGTNDPADIWTDFVDVTVLGTPERQAQYAVLETKVRAWLADGTLQAGFTVAGHSLGGFLAGALLVDHPAEIAHAYLYNAPGVGGLRAGLQLLTDSATEPYLDLTKVANLIAQAGPSPVAGLGLDWGTPIPVAIESQSPLIWKNHSITTLADALAVHALFAAVDADLTLADNAAIFKAASAREAATLESVVIALGKLFLSTAPAIDTGDRDALYRAIHDIRAALPEDPDYTVISLATLTAAELQAAAGNPDALATRHALKELNPFAVLGADYSQFNANGELDLHSAGGQLTPEWLADRAGPRWRWSRTRKMHEEVRMRESGKVGSGKTAASNTLLSGAAESRHWQNGEMRPVKLGSGETAGNDCEWRTAA